MSSTSAETVADIEELLKQILVRVPALSLIRFKSVSKHWLSLISAPGFRRRHTLQNPNPKISAFFDESFNSIPLEFPPCLLNPFKNLTNSVPSASELRILQSCNGLFLCQTLKQRKHYPVYVVNPSTNQFRALSSPNAGRYGFVRYALAFDPSKSPHYKVVCVNNYSHYYNENEGQHIIEIYSSETGEWKHLETPFFRSPSDEGRDPDFIKRALHFDSRSREGAVYCNGAVHWIRFKSDLPFRSFADGRQEFVRDETDVLHYFDISHERLLVVPATTPVSSVVKSIPLRDTEFGKTPTMRPSLTQRYFGECGGRLYMIETYQHCNTQFDVLEMERDCSGWFVKYQVDLSPLVAALPGQDWNALTVLCLSQAEEMIQKSGDNVEGSSIDLLLHMPGKVISYNHMPGKVISYNLSSVTFKTSAELASNEPFLTSSDNHRNREGVTFPFMETLSCL